MRAGIFTIAVLASTLLATAAMAGTETQWTTTPTLWDSGPYHYDGAGNIAGIDDDIYRYDHVGRLKLATAGTTVPNQQSFTYDRYGNLTSITTTSAQTTSVYGFAVSDTTNQLGPACSGTVDGCFTGKYDPATGRQLGRIGTGEYTWDALGMMTELNTGRRERYVYDANDERILILDDVAGSDRYTLRDAAKKVARTLSFNRAGNTWTLEKDYVYRGSALLASFSGSQAVPDRHYHVDHLGSTRLVTDGGGTRLAIHTYLPYGPEAEGSERDGERVKFTGHERDSSSGTSPGFDLDYMHARYYDANAARFLTVDTARGRPMMPQSWNRYSYALNSPMKHVDPDGRREALVYGHKLNVEPGFLVVLANAKRQPEHVVMIAGFARVGNQTHALIAEHAPREHNKTGMNKGPLPDTRTHPVTITDSNSPEAGSGIWNSSRVAPMKVIENRTMSGEFHTETSVIGAVNAVNDEGGLRYDMDQRGSMGTATDCVGGVNHLLWFLQGDLLPGDDLADYMRDTQGKEVEGTAPEPK